MLILKEYKMIQKKKKSFNNKETWVPWKVGDRRLMNSGILLFTFYKLVLPRWQGWEWV